MFHLRCRSSWLGVLAFVSAATLCAVAVFAQSPEIELSSVQQVFVDAAKQFQIRGGKNGSELFELRPQPILNWTNPERRTSAGASFLWTLDGRPQVAMCIYPSGEKQFDHEFQSLSRFPLSASAGERAVWAPMGAGIEFRRFEKASSPAASLPVRLRQMRNLVREFSAKLVPPNRTDIPLRLLAAPIYRYPPPDPGSEVIDGSVFTFVQATDPEVLLVIEAVKDDGQGAVWQYALARMSMVPTNVFHDQKLVWETQWAVNRVDGPYYVITEYAGEDAEILSTE